MKKFFGILFMIGVVFSISSFSQNAPKKRGLDQFHISGGVRVEKPQDKTTAPTDRFTVYETPPREPEQVDSSTYEGLMKMVQEAASIEEGYRTSAARDGGPSLQVTPESTLARKLTSLNRVNEMYLTGLLDQKPLQDDLNVNILNQNKRMIATIMMVMDRVRTEQFNCEAPDLSSLCSNYYIGYVSNKDAYEKKVLIRGMLTQLKKSFESLKRNVAIRQ